MIDIVTGEIIDNNRYIFEEDALVCEDHYVLSINIFPTVGIPATDVLRFKNFQDALNTYLHVFFKCDFVKDCTLIKHVPHVPKLFTVCCFRRTKEFKNFLPLPLDKPTYYVYNKEVLEYLFAKELTFAKA